MAERSCQKCFHYKACKEVASHSGYGDIYYAEDQCRNFTPTADVQEVKHAYWERIPGAYRCSECHCSPTLDGSGNWALTKYCHNCGAKMDLEETI